MSDHAPFTFTFSPHDLQLDAYLPVATGKLPALVVFHSGGMTSGSKPDVTGFQYAWLIGKAMLKDFIIISPNHRLLHPNTAEDIITDVHDLFKYLANPDTDLTAFLGTKLITLDTNRIGVIGISGGNYPARVAASMTSVIPHPTLWIPMYGMGGDFLLDHWVEPHSDVRGFAGLAMIPTAVAAFLEQGQPCSDAPLEYDTSLGAFNDKENSLGLYVHFYLTGTFLDYILGVPGISSRIRSLPYEQRLEAVPDDRRKYLLPLTKDAASALIIHGTSDTVVPTAEGIKTLLDMRSVGAHAEYIWVEGAAHDPDNTPNMVSGLEEGQVAHRALEFVDRQFMKS